MLPNVSGFSFPNDIHIMWSLMIVMYPYVTGLVAGAFIVSNGSPITLGTPPENVAAMIEIARRLGTYPISL